MKSLIYWPVFLLILSTSVYTNPVYDDVDDMIGELSERNSSATLTTDDSGANTTTSTLPGFVNERACGTNSISDPKIVNLVADLRWMMLVVLIVVTLTLLTSLAMLFKLRERRSRRCKVAQKTEYSKVAGEMNGIVK